MDIPRRDSVKREPAPYGHISKADERQVERPRCDHCNAENCTYVDHGNGEIEAEGYGPTTDTLSTGLYIRLSPEQLARWRAAAAADGRTLSAWLRRVADMAAEAEVTRRTRCEK